MAKRPGGELATRPLHFIWIADCSGSMSVDGKIQALNTAIRDGAAPFAGLRSPCLLRDCLPAGSSPRWGTCARSSVWSGGPS